MTKHWALQDAKARFSELVRASAKEPQHVTVRGQPAAVLLSEDEHRRLLRQKPNRSFVELWDTAPIVPEFKVPPAGKDEKDRFLKFHLDICAVFNPWSK